MPTIKTASGNPIAITDSANAPLQGLRVYGKTTQDGTPTPDAPVPLVSVGDDGAVDVKVAGKNLLPMFNGNVSDTGVSVLVNADGSITLSGTATERVVLNILLPSDSCRLLKGTYTLSTGAVLPTGVKFTSEWYLNGKWQNTLGVVRPGNHSATFSTEKKVVFAAYVSIEVGTTLDKFTIYPQLEVGSTATAYEPCKTAQTITLSTPNGLPGIPVRSGGNYTDADGQQWIADEIDFERGKYVQRVKRVVFDGSSDEGWKQRSTSAGGTRQYTTIDAVFVESGNATIARVLCDRFTAVSADSTWRAVTGLSLTARENNLPLLDIYHPDFAAASVADWTEWLATNPVTCVFVLEAPVETDLTIDEVLAYKALKTNHPNTTIMSDEDAWLYAAYIQQYAGFTTCWTDPKTDWKNGDYFNLDPDYERIKNNITHVHELANKINARVEIDAMGDYTITEYPLAAFLNTIATNIEKLSKSMFLVTPTAEMPMHVGNGPGWTAEELNDIEGNLLNMYNELNRQHALIPRLDIKMGIGGINFGS